MLSEEPGKRVLVVDDNEDVLRSIGVLLELAGFSVSTKGKCEDALAEIGNQKYDLLILDVTMPGMDGVELFQVVKNNEEYKETPVLFTSGLPIWSEPEGERKEIFKRAEAYMQKPFNIAAFIDTVRYLTSKQMPASGYFA